MSDGRSNRGFRPTPHPVFRIPDPAVLAALGPDKGQALLDQREELIRQEKSDPWQYGYEPPHWDRAEKLLALQKELWCMGGNRAGKSEFAAKLVVKRLLSGARKRVWCFQTTSPNSIEMQQPLIWKYLPKAIKDLNGRRGTIANVSYSQKNGFTENTFVLPNGSQCWFRNYAQDISTIEGGELDLIWFDELVPIDFVVTGRYRLVTRNGDLLVTFTAKDGYTATVKDVLTGAQTIEETDAKLLPIYGDVDGVRQRIGYEKVPVEQRSLRRQNAAILYFHTEANPYSGYARMVEELKGAPREEIKMRAYGVPTKSIGSRFALFSDRVHVIPPSRIPSKGTNYHLVDPCAGRNWFMLWIRVDEAGRAFVYREWPGQTRYIDGVGYPGEWALPDGKLADGKQGPAQKGFGFGLDRYKEEIEALEEGETIFERWMDSRYGNSQTVAKERATTLIEECSDIGLDFLATPGQGVDEGIDMINDWLHYDTRRPIDGTNQPRLYISEECKNTIYALGEWTGADGKTGATKDPIDLLRYFVLSDPQNVEGDILMTRRGYAY